MGFADGGIQMKQKQKKKKFGLRRRSRTAFGVVRRRPENTHVLLTGWVHIKYSMSLYERRHAEHLKGNKA